MLRLLCNDASPFSRKVRLSAAERGIKLQLERVIGSPAQLSEELDQVAPLAKIPVLITFQGPIYDSRVICRYLDRLGEGPSLYISENADTWEIQRIEALCDGIIDAAILCRYELVVRPFELQWSAWLSAQRGRIERALDELEATVARLAGQDVGSFAAASALTYLDFRHPSLPWRSQRLGLARWLDERMRVQSMRDTEYRDLVVDPGMNAHRVPLSGG